MDPKQLKARYAYMFEGQNLGILFARGWQPVFSDLCEEIDSILGADKRGFRWIQVKEKLGNARFYFSLGGGNQLRLEQELDVLRAQISRRARIAEELTCSRCVVCGANGTRRNLSGYLLVLCDEHARLARERSIWPLARFREDE